MLTCDAAFLARAICFNIRDCSAGHELIEPPPAFCDRSNKESRGSLRESGGSGWEDVDLGQENLSSVVLIMSSRGAKAPVGAMRALSSACRRSCVPSHLNELNEQPVRFEGLRE